MNPDPTARAVLWANVSALMRHHWRKENLSRLAREANIGPGSASRIKDQETSVGIDIVQAVADVFGLQPWQLMTPGLDPKSPPAYVMPASEYRHYLAMKEVLSGLTREPQPERRQERRAGYGRRATDRA